MHVHAYPWMFIRFHGCPWISLDILAHPRISMHVHGWIWNECLLKDWLFHIRGCIKSQSFKKQSCADRKPGPDSAPARKLEWKSTFSKVDFGSNDPSQIKATRMFCIILREVIRCLPREPYSGHAAPHSFPTENIQVRVIARDSPTIAQNSA